MANGVAIVGIGKIFNEKGLANEAYYELLYRATKSALLDAKITGEDINITISAADDFLEGRALANQGAVDPLGGVHKEADIRVCSDATHTIISGYFEALTNPGKIVVAGAVQKGSDRSGVGMAEQKCLLSALDPSYSRPVVSSLPSIAGIEHAFAAMEMRKYMHIYGISEEQIAMVAVKNINNAMRSGSPDHLMLISLEEVLNSEYLSGPLKQMEMANPTDGAFSVIMCTEDRAREITEKPVMVKGIGWCSDSSLMQSRKLGKTIYAYEAAKQAYRMAEIKQPVGEIQVAEVDDTYAYKELQHCEALGFCGEGKGGESIEKGLYETDGVLPVNPSGGLLGLGNTVGVGGLRGVVEAALQVRGDAGQHQISNVETALALSWSGLPFHCGSVIILGS